MAFTVRKVAATSSWIQCSFAVAVTQFGVLVAFVQSNVCLSAASARSSFIHFAIATKQRRFKLRSTGTRTRYMWVDVNRPICLELILRKTRSRELIVGSIDVGSQQMWKSADVINAVAHSYNCCVYHRLVEEKCQQNRHYLKSLLHSHTRYVWYQNIPAEV